MTNVVIFPPYLSQNGGGGTRIYCEAISTLFENDMNFNIQVSQVLPHPTKMFGYRYDMNAIKKLAEQSKPKIFHLNGYTSQIVSQFVPFAKKNGINTVYTAHWHPFETMKHSFLKKQYFNLFVRPFLKDIDAIVCINPEEEAFFRKYHDNVTLIPHWLKPLPFDLKPETKKEKMILFIGPLNYGNKGFNHLFYLPQNKYDIHCVGVGKAELRSDMTQHVRISIEELYSLYQQAALLVVPSRYEAFSYVSLEALSVGTPIVVSNNVRISDYLSDCKGCNVFEYNNPHDFNDKVEQTIGEQVDLELIRNRFSDQEAKKKYLSLYQSVIK